MVATGEFEPSKSRTKCMFIFQRPPQHYMDPAGNAIVVPSAGKTNCALPKGHHSSYRHMNVRGERPDGTCGDFGKTRDEILKTQGAAVLQYQKDLAKWKAEHQATIATPSGA